MIHATQRFCVQCKQLCFTSTQTSIVPIIKCRDFRRNNFSFYISLTKQFFTFHSNRVNVQNKFLCLQSDSNIRLLHSRQASYPQPAQGFGRGALSHIFKITAFKKYCCKSYLNANKIKLQRKRRQLLIQLNFPSFSSCKIIENVIQIKRNVTFRTHEETSRIVRRV